MKISKIELQNINSLKSETPLIIDFENEQFRDVGLYAITGSTGAGKTTILDAITIALYNSVPRFNGTKGTLIDVVSYGATEAFSRVSFKNNSGSYEAYWGIRLATKAGKALKNPQEEVRLIDLNNGVTLAESKTTVLEKIIQVTQLDYKQFLRSVMLAQGEFASFLSAKGPEKGRLLEQITGERIYKKIGQSILDRKSNEENKLKEIQSRINADDVLTEEQNVELKAKDKALDDQIVGSNKEIEQAQATVNWHLKAQELTQESEKIAKDFKILNDTAETHKEEFLLLEMNEKAEPFAPFIEKINTNEKNSSDKANQLKTLDAQLAQLKPEIEGLTRLYEKETKELEKSNQEFSIWLPQFDLITKIDGELKSAAENKQKTEKQLEEVKQQIATLQKDERRFTKDRADISTKIISNEAFITKNKFLTAVSLEISNWTSNLTTLKGNKETRNEHVLFVTNKKKEVEISLAELTENKKLLTAKSAEIDKIEKEIKTINEQLSKNNLKGLLSEQKKKTLAIANWKQLKSYAEEKAKKEAEQVTLTAQKTSLSQTLETIIKKGEALSKQIATQETAVADGENILNLEKSIAKYEEDRQHLIDGEPCALCGSTEHPYTRHLKSMGVSKSELELKHRKEVLKTLIDSKSESDKKEVELTTSIRNLSQQLLAIVEEINTIKTKASQLNLDTDLNDLNKIDLALDTFTKEGDVLDEKITTTQKLQVSKDQLEATSKTQNQATEVIKRAEATLSEKIKNAQEEIRTKQTSITTLDQLCSTLEQDLKTKLGNYNYELPDVNSTSHFIATIEQEIADYNKTQKESDTLKADIKILDNKLNDIKLQLKKQVKDQTDYTKTINDSLTLWTQLKTKRTNLLPLDITVANKRAQLQSLSKQLTEQLELSKSKLQKKLDKQRENTAVRAENIKEQEVLKEKLNQLHAALNAQLTDTDFQLKIDLEKALLNKEVKQKYVSNRERIKEQEVKLQTLKETHNKALENLNKSKSSDITEADSKQILSDLKTKKDALSAEKGEIKEAFRKDKEIRDRNQEISKKIDAQVEVCNTWKELFRIIGNSKDAFNIYVQRLTLKHLLDIANVHLFKLNKRYSLKMEETYKPKEELNFNLIDHYQTDQARLVDTSSGGEKFIISLALALGLSDLASKNVKIDSLFIDEGFGSLDNNTLETVICTLETLQSQGKMIGIISHVDNLKERIPTQIQITKKSNGVSVVDIL